MSGKTAFVSTFFTLWLVLLILLQAAWVSYQTCRAALRAYDLYLAPQIQSLSWTDERKENEATYYVRYCDEQDLRTHDDDNTDKHNNNTSQHPLPASRLLADTPREAAQVFLQEGFVVLPRVLTEELAHKLRDYVLRKNQATNPTGLHYNGLYAHEHRYLITLGTAEHDVVGDVLQHVARSNSSAWMRQALTEILGTSPALIEMDVITSKSGAAAQDVHSDGVGEMSALLYARSFAPTHVLLVQLQDSTADMGVTRVCPRTHYCYDGPYEDLCQQEPEFLFPAVWQQGHGGDPDSHNSNNSNHNNNHNNNNHNNNDHNQPYWPAGSGVLMNTNALHRGGAYTADDDHPHRAMLVLTFAPHRQPRTEARMLTHGLSYSLPWYMWGHTLNDMAAAHSIMVRPWTWLRALGLYKNGQTTVWGTDFVSLWLRRFANEFGPFDGGDALQAFLFQESGSGQEFFYWLHGKEALRSCPSYLQFVLDTAQRLSELAWTCTTVLCGLYLVLCMTVFTVYRRQTKQSTTTTTRQSKLGWFMMGMLFVTLLGWSAFFFAINYTMDHSTWAKDVRGGLVNTVPFTAHAQDALMEKTARTTVPLRMDVLIETRFGSDYLAMYNQFIDFHPGNVQWNGLVQQRAAAFGRVASTAGCHGNVFTFATTQCHEMALSIVQHDMLSDTRFLWQNRRTGAWHVLSTRQAVQETILALARTCFPVLGHVLQRLRFLESDCLYGFRRNTALCRRHLDFSTLLQNKLQERFVLPNENVQEHYSTPKKDANFYFQKVISMANHRLVSHRPSALSLSLSVMLHRRALPRRNASETVDSVAHQGNDNVLVPGDRVLAKWDGDWYVARLEKVTPTSMVRVRLDSVADDDDGGGGDDGSRVHLLGYREVFEITRTLYPGRDIRVEIDDHEWLEARVVRLELESDVLVYAEKASGQEVSLPFSDIWMVDFGS